MAFLCIAGTSPDVVDKASSLCDGPRSRAARRQDEPWTEGYTLPGTNHLDTREDRRTGLGPRPVPLPVSQRLFQRRAQSCASESRDMAPWPLDHLPPLRFLLKRSNRGRSSRRAEGRGGAIPQEQRGQPQSCMSASFQARTRPQTAWPTKHQSSSTINPPGWAVKGAAVPLLLVCELPHPKQWHGHTLAWSRPWIPDRSPE
jgi:hypothetical protein